MNTLTLNAIQLNGGRGSGWFNPDHAAAVIADHSTIAPSLNGDGKALVRGIMNNYAIEDAITNTGVNLSTTSTTTSQTYKDIVEERGNASDLYCTMKRNTGTGLTNVTSYKTDDKAAMNAADRVVQVQKDLASQLTKYATAVPGDDWVGTTKVEINKRIKQAKKLIAETKKFRVGLQDNDGKFTNITDALNNTQRQLQKYYDSVAASSAE